MSKLSDIKEFQGTYRWLSNFWPTEVELDGKIYPTVEHAFQAAKTLDENAREEIRLNKNPAEAKKLGRKVTLREDWESIKLDIMYGLLKQKFSKDPWKSMLAATKGRRLIEGNWWQDKFWGVCDGEGENNLGKLLMKIRRTIKE